MLDARPNKNLLELAGKMLDWQHCRMQPKAKQITTLYRLFYLDVSFLYVPITAQQRSVA